MLTLVLNWVLLFWGVEVVGIQVLVVLVEDWEAVVLFVEIPRLAFHYPTLSHLQV